MDWTKEILGLGAQPIDLNLLQVSLRAIIVFVGALVIVRLANRRFLSKITAVDTILGFVLASMFARAVNGSAPLFPTLGAGLVLVVVHRFVAWLAYSSDWFGRLVKGRPEPIIQDGELNRKVMHAYRLSQEDLLEELRQEGKVEGPKQVKKAFLERSGKISVVPQKE